MRKRISSTLLGIAIAFTAVAALAAAPAAQAAPAAAAATPHYHVFKLDYSSFRYCMDADANHFGSGARVQLWTCNNNTNQGWYYTQTTTSPNWNVLASKRDARYCLTASKAGSGASLHLYLCNDSSLQHWDLNWVGAKGLYEIRLQQYDSYCVEADGNHLGNGDTLLLGNCPHTSDPNVLRLWESVIH